MSTMYSETIIEMAESRKDFTEWASEYLLYIKGGGGEAGKLMKNWEIFPGVYFYTLSTQKPEMNSQKLEMSSKVGDLKNDHKKDGCHKTTKNWSSIHIYN